MNGDFMKNISKFKVEKGILIPIIIFMVISIVTVFSAKSLLPDYQANIWLKQGLWYLIGFGIAYFIMSLGNDFLYNASYVLYGFNVILLILVLFIGKEANNSKCWFDIFGVGIQPSEFMKFSLIILLSRLMNEYNVKNTNPSIQTEFKFLLKIMILVFIPSALTFIEPDTGAVIIYLVIMFAILFIGGIRKRWFTLALGTLIFLVGSLFIIFFFNKNLFIKFFGTSFFYRIDRILNWSLGDGGQLNKSLIAIGSSGILGHGFNHTPLYFPELQTDFIFGVYASNFGFLGSIMLILLLIIFDMNLISSASKTYDSKDKYAIAGIIGMLVFQQIQNIGMTIGLLPIMGITLPFISYGGSSLISYMLLVGIIFNVSNQSLRYTN